MACIWVIGGANIDICGAAEKELIERDSNIGEICLGFGGVGRNIAQACALLGEPVRFVTCFADDHFGELLRADCEALGMDCRWSATSTSYPSSMYLALLDADGDMRIGMSDMRILEDLSDEVLDRAIKDMDPSDILVIDSNLQPERIGRIVARTPCRIAADPVSANKAPRLARFLDRIQILKPNRVEAEELSGIRVTDEDSARNCLQFFLRRGVGEVLLTLAGEGVLLGTAEGMWHLRHRELKMRSANGGGDSFLGAYLTRRIAGEDARAAVRFAMSAAAITVEGDVMRKRTLSREIVQEEIRNLNIKETAL